MFPVPTILNPLSDAAYRVEACMNTMVRQRGKRRPLAVVWASVPLVPSNGGRRRVLRLRLRMEQ